ncbi:MAG: hypothetical protein JAY64_09380 [Candidatus Thiodiazotropha weberae]|nr:hypothetical protein [Candidatus Thiodiazotropha lotti]MCG8011899.1 hypothetical protein [Candidatus Thiodiazotropha lotti]MCW4211366.1 hypothetical protein [Candidatus Thiodiazotropha lotti]MCW4216777.1 hypothetical protein [Candidatus Thiodiazotropha lotti]
MIDLSFSEEGWRRIDSASISVKGDGDKIREEMKRIVDDDVVVSLFRKIGISSTAFLFHDTLLKETKFYNKGKSYTYKSKYLWDDKDIDPKWSACIHELFILVRQSQYGLKLENNASLADYFINLHNENGAFRSLSAEQEWKNNYAIHYCTQGEMLYTAFVWRFLYRCLDKNLGDKPIDSLSIPLNDKTPISECYWQAEPITSPNYPEASKINYFTSYWNSTIKKYKSWLDEWESLLINPNNKDNKSNLASILLFIEDSAFSDSTQKIANSASTNEINSFLTKKIPTFLAWLSPDNPPRTVIEAIDTIEKYARFPVLPFYAWNAINGSPVCYTVVPVWTSQNYFIKVPNGECRHLGLALSALRPQKDIDWTIENSTAAHICDYDLLIIINMLRIMSRPLVESNLYHWLYQHIKDDQDIEIEEAVNKSLEKRKKS